MDGKGPFEEDGRSHLNWPPAVLHGVRQMTARSKLTSLYLSGFKSFAYSAPVERRLGDGTIFSDYQGKRVTFGDVTLFLGANGAGKSNVVSLFRLLNFMTTAALQDFIGRGGGAASLLHYGPQLTPRMDVELEFTTEERTSRYSCTLSSAAPDTLIFTKEEVEYHHLGFPQPQKILIGSGHKESELKSAAHTGNQTAGVVLGLLQGCRFFQFHDTSENAKIRKAGYVEDTKHLRSDAGNLAAFVMMLAHNHQPYYDRIIRTIAQVCPQFSRFDLEPSDRNPDYVLLNWRGRHHSEYLMGPHQLSDGTLRFMALATLFLQPPEMLPPVIIIDEPELGLHPSALAVLADLVKGASEHSQVILATQSRTFVDNFDLEHIRPMEHTAGASRFLELDLSSFSHWLEEYSTGELWEKNVIGAGPRYD
ncbi:MAG: AAA family ATPase [Acidobacteriota bacterium]